ncbi:MAG TPA: hypothetical protein VG841_06240 [Caulobacterales bacterium]|nr:hypothetical protein [Caulobacterales bacterium]
MSKFQIRIPSADRRITNQATQLGEHFSEAVPKAVAAVEAFAAKNGLWYLLARNPEATSCADAANKRQSLGGFGIPIERELKSFLGEFQTADGSTRRVAIHCRGSDRLDLDRSARAIGATASIVRVDAGAKSESDLYGLVNPFLLELDPTNPPLQVFDEALFRGSLVPPTVLTNAGDRTWSIEFRVEHLFAALPPSRRCRAEVVLDQRSVLSRPAFGILTGNSPESGALLWELLNRRVRQLSGELVGDIYMPRVYLRSIPAMGMTMDLHLRRDQIWDAIGPEIEGLCADLAVQHDGQRNVLAIACNTTPHFSPEIREIASGHNVRYMSIAETLEGHLYAEGIRQLVLLGIGYIHRPEFSGYARLFRNPEFRIHKLTEVALAEIEALAFEVKEGADLNKCSQKLNALLQRNDLRQENVVIALTELSLIATKAKWRVAKHRDPQDSTQRLVMDSLAIYADVLADIFLGRRDLDSLAVKAIGTSKLDSGGD